MAGYFTPAVAAVIAERVRQIQEEGFTAEHDDRYAEHELPRAAVCYAMGRQISGADYPRFWPWAMRWWKPGTHRDNLIKAGALILAEIERLDRLHAARVSAGTDLGAALEERIAEVTFDISGDDMKVKSFIELVAARQLRAVPADSLLKVVRCLEFDAHLPAAEFASAFDDLRDAFTPKEIATGNLGDGQ